MHSTTLHIGFLTHEGQSAGYAHLTVELPFPPSTDIEFEHSTWRDPKRASSVSFNLLDSTFFVYLELHKLAPGVDIQRNADMYRSHGWDVRS